MIAADPIGCDPEAPSTILRARPELGRPSTRTTEGSNMGHQVNFYTAPADIKDLQERVGRLESILILHSHSLSETPLVLSSLRHTEGDRPWLFYYFVRKCDLANVISEHVPSQGYWGIDVLRSPVVEFHGCFFNGKILRRGRVYYTDGFYGENDEWLQKSESFRSWAKRVLKTTKAGLKRQGSDYIGPAAEAWLAQGDGSLV
ncbi:MAG: hypothetical protein R3B06_04525 [Kofleriaceae bacterium]